MFARLRALQGATTSLPPLVTTWFERTTFDLSKIKGPTARADALHELGILGQRDFKEINRLFKASAGYETAPKTLDPLKKVSHKKKQLDETLKFIEEHPLPSQEKRKVFGKK